MENTAILSPTETGFNITGSVSFASVVALRQAGEAWLDRVARAECKIGLQSMESLDASVFSLLLCWMRYAKRKGMTLSFEAASQDVLRMQQLFGLENIWHSC